MDAELKSRWVAALRSGEFKQTRGRLKMGNSYCCLGVLCAIHGQGFDEDSPAKKDWSGSYDNLLPITREEAHQLWIRNDGAEGQREHSFSEIADFIEVFIFAALPSQHHGNKGD
jgi:hypothetical protein